jgi:hypothetical protein
MGFPGLDHERRRDPGPLPGGRLEPAVVPGRDPDRLHGRGGAPGAADPHPLDGRRGSGQPGDPGDREPLGPGVVAGRPAHRLHQAGSQSKHVAGEPASPPPGRQMGRGSPGHRSNALQEGTAGLHAPGIPAHLPGRGRRGRPPAGDRRGLGPRGTGVDPRRAGGPLYLPPGGERRVPVAGIGDLPRRGSHRRDHPPHRLPGAQAVARGLTRRAQGRLRRKPLDPGHLPGAGRLRDGHRRLQPARPDPGPGPEPGEPHLGRGQPGTLLRRGRQRRPKPLSCIT